MSKGGHVWTVALATMGRGLGGWRTGHHGHQPSEGRVENPAPAVGFREEAGHILLALPNKEPSPGNDREPRE